ncbi:MAG: hypothetical protein Ta2F_18500 [Termitinemataceae bacterium]|nr:MAG: hypothetical protein Ta2F_18500 [Termitinemataceae bacterium]
MIILTEKPSVAAAFAGALGCTKKSGCFENDHYCIVHAVGHLLEQYEPQDYNAIYKKWELAHLPIIPNNIKYKVIENTKSGLAVIKKCFDAHKGEPLLLATDAEREGELIGAEILAFVGFSAYANARRFWVSEALTRDVILTGIKNAKPLSEYEAYKKQGYARQHADWLIGMNLTRFITLSCGSLLTVGRVQTAVLSAIYDRETRIAHFVKDKYLEIIATLKADNYFSLKLIHSETQEFPTRFSENSVLVKQVISSCKIPNTGKVISLKKRKTYRTASAVIQSYRITKRST